MQPEEQCPSVRPVSLKVADRPLHTVEERLWSSGLLASFFMEPKRAAMCCCCGCCGVAYTYGLTQERLSKGERKRWTECCIYTLASCTVVSCCMGWSNRFRLRKSFHIKGSMCGDCFAHTCCQPCAIIQEYRSVKLQGWEEAGTLWDELAVQYILPPSSMKDGGVIDPISPEAETIAL